jgi:NAD(P)-dependent dehydrogenase (short-subunit alcohol dehydrogenase family)
MITLDFTGKNAIVTGGGSGIAKAIALQLAEAGANVWIGEIVEKNAQATIDEMKKYQKSYGYTKTDVSKKEDVEAMFRDAKERFGKIDIVVNAAGVFAPVHFIEAGAEDIKRYLDINLMGVIYGCQIALREMIEQGGGGKIVNISSVGGRQGDPEFPYYALGKAGIINLTQSAAYCGAPHRINVNAVCPGIIRTPMWDTILKGMTGGDPNADYDKLFNDVLLARTPLGRAQTGDDIAYTVLFLCSRYTDEVTGQSWNVCGGSVMS